MEVFENLEKAVLGSIILEPYAIREVVDDLKPKCFKKRENKLIYEVLCDMHNKSLPIDLLTISTELHNRGLLNTIGGAYYVSTLTNDIVSSVHIKIHARGLIQEYLKSEAVIICHSIIQDVTQPHCDILDVFETVKKKFDLTLSEVSNNKEFKTISSIGDDYVERLNKIVETGKSPCLPTFSHQLSKYGFYHNSDLTYIGARPGMGKTGFLISEVRHQSFVNNIPVGVFSLEMSADQLLNRIVSAECQINGMKISNGDLDKDDVYKINQKLIQLAKHNLFIDDTARLDIDILCSRAKRMYYDYGIKHLFIDYIGLVSTREYRNDKTNSTGYISNRLKALAKELNIPVTVLSQLSREIEKRPIEQRMPTLSDLRNSGDIEQDADLIMFLFRPEYYGVTQINIDGNELIDVAGKGFVGVAKNRHGKCGTELIDYVAPFTEFR